MTKGKGERATLLNQVLNPTEEAVNYPWRQAQMFFSLGGVDHVSKKSLHNVVVI
jgi:hypothetical protein